MFDVVVSVCEFGLACGPFPVCSCESGEACGCKVPISTAIEGSEGRV